MKSNERRNWPGLIAVSFLLAFGNVRSTASEVHDNAGLFSAAAIQQAGQTIRNLQQNFHKTLLVETFPGVPEARKAEYERNREQFFADFLRERAQAARLDGIYVMIMKELPPHAVRIQVGVGQATRQRAFLAGDRDELVRLLQSSVRAQQYDDGIIGNLPVVHAYRQRGSFLIN